MVDAKTIINVKQYIGAILKPITRLNHWLHPQVLICLTRFASQVSLTIFNVASKNASVLNNNYFFLRLQALVQESFRPSCHRVQSDKHSLHHLLGLQDHLVQKAMQYGWSHGSPYYYITTRVAYLKNGPVQTGSPSAWCSREANSSWDQYCLRKCFHPNIVSHTAI